ncbi:MAG: hypothetical protein OXJ52_10075 [Oligoflexia bacterium]|nr:hypothetical protein [Oligoflexia bacterium]
MSFSKDIIDASKRQQQPPLDYYFSAFSHNVFGENKFAVRFHAMFFYLILCFALPLGLYFFCSSLWITVIGFLLFSINHVIRLHSIDARPLCLALLTGFLFLFFYLSYIRDNDKQDLDKKSLFPVFSSQYLFVVSIGLQPVIFIISLFLSSFWLFLFKQKIAFKKLFVTNIAAGLLTAPFYINMLLFGKSAYKFKEISTDTIKSYFRNLDVFYFIEKYFFSFYKEMSFFFLAVTTGLIALAFLKKKLETSLLLIILSSLIFFPLIYDSIFQIGLIWNGLHNWYIIVFSLFLILFIVLSLKEIESLMPKSWKIYFALSLFLLFAGSLFSQAQAVKNKTQFWYPYRDNSIEKVYEYLRKEGSQTDIAVEITLKPIVLFRDSDIKFRELLFHDQNNPTINYFHLEYTKTAPFFYESKEDIIYYIEKWPDQPVDKNLSLFFIVRKENDQDEAYNVLSSFMKGVAVGKYIVFNLTLSQNKEEEYIHFLSKVNERTPKKYKGALLETLLYYAYQNKNESEFHRLLQEYRDIEMALDEFIPDFKYPSRFELRRRVKYFENLKWD